jgi:hypothetical protein
MRIKGKILCDIGSAEGIFVLDAIEYVDHIYLNVRIRGLRY